MSTPALPEPSTTTGSPAGADAAHDHAAPTGAASSAAPVVVGATGTFAALAALHALADCYGGMWPIFKHLAGLDLTKAGLIATVCGVAASSIQPLLGMWCDRGHQRLMIVAGACLTSLTMVLGPLGAHPDLVSETARYAIMFAVIMLMSIGQSMFHPAGASVAGRLSPQRRSTFVALFIAAGMSGYALSQGTFAAVYHATGGHTELMLIPAALVLLVAGLRCRPAAIAVEDRPTLRDMWRDVQPVRRHILILYFTMVLVGFVNAGLVFLMPEFTTERGCAAWLVNGGAFGFYVAGGMLLMVPVGHLADRVGRKRVLAGTFALSIVGYAALVAPWGALPAPVFALACLAAGGGIGAVGPLAISMGQQLLPRHQSAVSGVLMGLAWSLANLAPWLVANLAERPGLGAGGALAWLGLALVAATALAMFMPGHRVAIDPSQRQ